MQNQFRFRAVDRLGQRKCNYGRLGIGRAPSPNPLNRIKVGSVAVASLEGVPLTGAVLEPASPHHEVGAVLGVPCTHGLNHPEAVLWGQG
jgi:hypothetical protein